jgi:hypothetical protein
MSERGTHYFVAALIPADKVRAFTDATRIDLGETLWLADWVDDPKAMPKEEWREIGVAAGFGMMRGVAARK